MLDAALKSAQARGLSKFTLWQTRDGWQANAMYKNNGAWVVNTDASPVTASLAVLSNERGIPRCVAGAITEDAGIFG